ncbi:hypothetical protein ABAC460_08905 [Asticcacaulis sp. AC460]|nr:hypothetical protein ABAC460_08905 [Asticcacaulis sp. AC460]
MSELPNVERTKYMTQQRLTDAGFAVLCFAAPFIYNMVYPGRVDYFLSHVLAGDFEVLFWPHNIPGEFHYNPYFRTRIFSFFLFIPIAGVWLMLRSLFKMDTTWTVSEDSVTCDIVSLNGRRREAWSIREIAQVRLRRILLEFGDTRYGLDLVLRSGKVLELPAKRLRTTAERVKADIEAAAGIG